jgi:hypothetical protein
VWVVRVAILASIALSGAAVVGVVLDRLDAMSAPLPSVLGLRLGATPDEVRAAREGDWTSRVDQSGDYELSREGETYAFHEGGLVAVDVLVPASAADAQGPGLVVTTGSVLARERLAEGVRVRLVSRTCPTHADTAQALVGRAGR